MKRGVSVGADAASTAASASQRMSRDRCAIPHLEGGGSERPGSGQPREEMYLPTNGSRSRSAAGGMASRAVMMAERSACGQAQVLSDGSDLAMSRIAA